MLDSANIPFQSSGDWLSFSDFILAIYQPQADHMTNLGTGSSLFCKYGVHGALPVRPIITSFYDGSIKCSACLASLVRKRLEPDMGPSCPSLWAPLMGKTHAKRSVVECVVQPVAVPYLLRTPYFRDNSLRHF
jgi:hypothetical protein